MMCVHKHPLNPFPLVLIQYSLFLQFAYVVNEISLCTMVINNMHITA